MKHSLKQFEAINQEFEKGFQRVICGGKIAYSYQIMRMS